MGLATNSLEFLLALFRPALLLFYALIRRMPFSRAFSRKSSQTPLEWKLCAKMPCEREEPAVASLGGKLYSAGGFERGNKISSRFERFDPKANKWEELPRLPEPRHHMAAASYGGKFYIFGGHTDKKCAKTDGKTYSFDPKINKWERKADMPTPRGAARAAVAGKKIFVIGGRSGGSILQGNFKPALATVEAYNPEKDAWEKKSPMRVARDHPSVCGLGGKIYAFGGRRWILLNALNDSEVYDPEEDSWSPAEKMPLPISGCAFSMGGRIIIPGGTLGVLLLPDILSYSPVKGWEHLGLMPSAGHGCGACEIEGAGYVVGGGPTFFNRYSGFTRAAKLKARAR